MADEKTPGFHEANAKSGAFLDNVGDLDPSRTVNDGANIWNETLCLRGLVIGRASGVSEVDHSHECFLIAYHSPKEGRIHIIVRQALVKV